MIGLGIPVGTNENNGNYRKTYGLFNLNQKYLILEAKQSHNIKLNSPMVHFLDVSLACF